MEQSALAVRRYSELAFQVQNKGSGEKRRGLIRELASIGVPVPAPEMGRIMALHDHVLSKPGVVVIGSTAFEAYCGMKGFTGVDPALISTKDVDIACVTPFNMPDHNPPMSAMNSPTRVLARGGASIDFVTPRPADKTEVQREQRHEKQMVYVRRFDSYAYVLPGHMQLLLAQPVRAVILHDDGLPVNVPDPTRFALHKLVLSETRSHKTKADKDRIQAMVLLHSASQAGNKFGVMQEFAEYAQGMLVRPIHDALAKCKDTKPPGDIVDFFNSAVAQRPKPATKTATSSALKNGG